jgi:diaminopimelate decarboxylase
VGRIVIDSFDEIDRSSGWCHRPIRPGLRFQGAGPHHPGVEVHTHRVRAHRTGRLQVRVRLASGAAGHAVERLSELAAKGVVEFVGIHAHLGSQVFALAPFAQAIEVLAEFFAPLGLPELVVGGGSGVPYVNGEEAPPMAQWAASVRRPAVGRASPTRCG